MNVEIPRGDFDTPGPCWIPIQWEGKAARPVIICKCGHRSHCSLHHFRVDGTVTASFFHDVAPHPDIGYAGGGCGWHVFLKLLDYDQGEFPPAP